VPAEEEEAYTMECVNANFSNFSAWHARTVLLPAIHKQQPTTSLADLIAADRAQPPSAPDSQPAQPAGAPGCDLQSLLVVHYLSESRDYLPQIVCLAPLLLDVC